MLRKITGNASRNILAENRKARSGLKIAAAVTALGGAASAASAGTSFIQGDLVVSLSNYSASPSLIKVGQPLPGGGTAVADATYPTVFANDTQDGSFGVTSPITLNQYAVTGTTSVTLNNSIPIDTNQIVTSFSSKSELSLNLSPDGHSLTFMGYVAPVNTLDVSNSNTPGVVDPTNPVKAAYSRGIGQLDASGNLTVVPTNAYSGNNGRAAIVNNGNYYLVGNSNNGSGTPANIVAVSGAQVTTKALAPTTVQDGSYSVTQNGFPADKAGKDNNFRGETIFNNTLYVTKGSGSNGLDTVYQVGTAGTLPTAASPASSITVLPGFPTTLAKNNNGTGFYPFALFFANATTLYVADEGDGVTADAATDPHSGLEKWSLVNGSWTLDYTLQKGLNLGTQYGIANYPTALDPATDGIRNLTGRVNADGTVSLYGITSTISASGDQGADPNELVGITDTLSATSLPASESFTVLQTAAFGQVLRGVSFAPTAVPLPSAAAMGFATLGALGSVTLLLRRRRAGYSH
jgi:hypothetical protein